MKQLILFLTIILCCANALGQAQIGASSKVGGVATVGNPGGSCTTSADTIAVSSNATGNLGQFSGDAYFAMSFVAGSSYTLCKLSVQMNKTGSPVYNITASIYSDTAGAPGSAIGSASANVAASSLPGSAGTVTFATMSSAITNGTTYWIVLHATSTSDPNYTPWSYSSSSGAKTVYHSPDAVTWNTSNSFVIGLTGFTSYQ